MGRAFCQGRLREWEEMLKEGAHGLWPVSWHFLQNKRRGLVRKPGMKRRKSEQTFAGGQY